MNLTIINNQIINFFLDLGYFRIIPNNPVMTTLNECKFLKYQIPLNSDNTISIEMVITYYFSNPGNITISFNTLGIHSLTIEIANEMVQIQNQVLGAFSNNHNFINHFSLSI